MLHALVRCVQPKHSYLLNVDLVDLEVGCPYFVFNKPLLTSTKIDLRSVCLMRLAEEARR